MKKDLEKKLLKVQLKQEILGELVINHLRWHEDSKFNLDDYSSLLKKKQQSDNEWKKIYG